MVRRLQPDKGYVDDLMREFSADSRERFERTELFVNVLQARPEDGEQLAEIWMTTVDRTGGSQDASSDCG